MTLVWRGGDNGDRDGDHDDYNDTGKGDGESTANPVNMLIMLGKVEQSKSYFAHMSKFPKTRPDPNLH